MKKIQNIFLLVKTPKINFLNACLRNVNSSWECVVFILKRKYLSFYISSKFNHKTYGNLNHHSIGPVLGPIPNVENGEKRADDDEKRSLEENILLVPLEEGLRVGGALPPPPGLLLLPLPPPPGLLWLHLLHQLPLVVHHHTL